MLTKWSGDTSNFLCRLTNQCGDSPEVPDIQQIETVDCNDFQHEIVKGARLCFENGRLGRVKQGICYAILGPKDCNLDTDEMKITLKK